MLRLEHNGTNLKWTNASNAERPRLRKKQRLTPSTFKSRNEITWWIAGVRYSRYDNAWLLYKPTLLTHCKNDRLGATTGSSIQLRQPSLQLPRPFSAECQFASLRSGNLNHEDCLGTICAKSFSCFRKSPGLYHHTCSMSSDKHQWTRISRHLIRRPRRRGAHSSHRLK